MDSLELELTKKYMTAKSIIEEETKNNNLRIELGERIERLTTSIYEFTRFKQLCELSIPLLEHDMEMQIKQNLFTLEHVVNTAFSKLPQIEDYRLHLRSYLSNGKKALEVRVYNKNNPSKLKIPKLDCGKFTQQYISVCTQLCLQTLIGNNNIFMDEPISNGNSNSAIVFADMLKLFMSDKSSFYLIDQHPENFTSLPINNVKLDIVKSDDVRGFRTEVTEL